MIYEAHHLYNYISGFEAEKAINYATENNYQYIGIKKRKIRTGYNVYYLNVEDRDRKSNKYDVVFFNQDITIHNKRAYVYSEYAYIEEDDCLVFHFKKNHEIKAIPKEKIEVGQMFVPVVRLKETKEILSLFIFGFSKYNKVEKLKGLED